MTTRTGLHHFRQTEVENLCVAALGDENVCRLDIAVDDAFGMGRIESIGNLDSQRGNRVRIHRTIANMMLQRRAIEILHDDERFAILLINLMDGADVWVIECGCGSGFPLKTR